ncbi:hypothetical protein LI221_11860 [Faecalimonas umbilicata]|nr:hypothetical protein [Faecalimonas umbilicata]
MNKREENIVDELTEELQDTLEETVSEEVSESISEESEPKELEQQLNKKRNRVIIGITIVVLVIACIIGFMSCSNDEPDTTVQEEVEEKELPIITLKDEDTVVTGINQEVALQDVVRSIESEVGVESVLVEWNDMEEESTDGKEDATTEEETSDSEKDATEEKVVIADIKDGKEKNGVPAKSITFKEKGTYVINITAVDTEGGETVMPVTFEVGDELLSYVKGIKDWTVEKGSKDVDFMDGVTWDKEYVTSVTVDSSKVKLDTVGSYDLVYTVKGKITNEESTVTKKVTVKVIDEKTAQKKADEGEKVVTSGNEVKKDSSGNKPSGTTTSGGTNNSGNSNSQGSTKPSQPSSSDNNNNQGNNQGNTAKPSTPSTPSEPAHTHTWVTVPAQTHTVNHPAETHQEDQGWDESKWVHTGVTCGCGAVFSSVAEWDAHISSYVDYGDFSHPCHYSDNYEQQTVHHENWVTVVDREAWVETVVDVPAYQKCSTCGKTK